MVYNNEYFTEITTKTVEAANNFVHASLAGFQGLASAHLEASKELFSNASKAFQAIANSKNPAEFMQNMNNFTTDFIESNICNYTNACEIVNEINTTLRKMVDSNLDITQEQFAKSMDSFIQVTPLKSTSSITSFQSFMEGARKVINTMHDLTNQATANIANANIKMAQAAANSTTTTSKKTTANATNTQATSGESKTTSKK